MNSQWFQDRIKAEGKSQRALARVLGIDPAQVTHLFRGRRRMQLDEASTIAQFLGVQVEEVLRHAGLPVSGGSRKVKLAGYVDEHGELHLSDAPESDVEAPALAPEGTIAVRMRTSEMLMRNALVFFRPAAGVDPAAIGRLSVVRIGGGPWLLRSISPGVEPGTYDLAGQRGDIVGARLSAAAPVLWIRP
jgi:transcriptional regulator with XRE-family HTH domain